MASVPSTSSRRRTACKDRNQLNSIKHVSETSAPLPISPGAPPVGDFVKGKEAKQKSRERTTSLATFRPEAIGGRWLSRRVAGGSQTLGK